MLTSSFTDWRNSFLFNIKFSLLYLLESNKDEIE